MKQLVYLLNLSLIFFLNIFFHLLHATEPVIEKPIVIIIPSYNNAPYFQKNLDSIFYQEYNNWRAIYIDDASVDQTSDLVDAYIKEKGFTDKFKIIKNSDRLLAMANIYEAVHSCHDDEIIAIVDGDDWLASSKVLQLLNKIYQDDSVWLTYGGSIDWPEPTKEIYQDWVEKFGGFKNKGIPSDIIDHNDFRFFMGSTGHLRTFYSWLFKKVKLDDFMYQSSFLPISYDIGLMLPMHEMAKGRCKYLSDLVYIHNVETPFNDQKLNPDLQGRVEFFIRCKKKYQPLENNPTSHSKQFEYTKTNLIVFSFDRPLQLYALLESLELYAKGIDSISVIYRASEDSYKQAFKEVQNSFPSVQFLLQKGVEDFKSLTLQALHSAPSEYVLFAVDDNIVKDHVNLSECIEYLEQTQSYGFYLKLGTHLNHCYSNNCTQKVPSHVKIKENVYAWQFEFSEADWNYPNTLDMTLYRKKDIADVFEFLDYHNPNQLEGKWATWWTQNKALYSVGMFYRDSKVLNIPINRVQTTELNRHMDLYSKEELLEKFERGFKLDLKPLYQLKNPSVHIDYEPQFILR